MKRKILEVEINHYMEMVCRIRCEYDEAVEKFSKGFIPAVELARARSNRDEYLEEVKEELIDVLLEKFEKGEKR